MNEYIRIRSRSLSAWDQRTGHEPRVVALRAGRRTNVNSPSGRTRRMAELPDERQLVLGARSQLDRWTKSARREAYVELFDGDDPVLSPKRCNCSMRSTRNWSDRAAMVSGDRSVRNSHDGDLEFEYLTRGGLRLPSTDHHRFRPPRRGRPRRRDRRAAQRRALEIQRARRDTHRNTNSTSSFIKTSGTPDQIAFSDRTNLSIVAVSSVTGVTCLEVLFSHILPGLAL